MLQKLAVVGALATMTAISTPAIAQQAQTPVVVFDQDRVVREAAVFRHLGNEMNKIFKADGPGLEAQQKAAEAELQQIMQAPALKGKTQEEAYRIISADATLKAKAEAVQSRANAIQSTRRDWAATEQAALRLIEAQLGPALDDAMNARGANLVVRPEAIVRARPTTDITADVIARLNQRMTTVPVPRVKAPPPQAPQAQPAPAR
jgi:outer membrane protein